MPEINQLPTLSTLKGDDLVPVFSTANGDARKASVNTFAELVAEEVNALIAAPSNAVPQSPTPAGAPGIDVKYARGDHSHPSDAPQPANVAPADPAPSAAIGTSLLYARQDHVHKSDAPPASTVLPSVPTTFGAIGVSTEYARADHSHPSDAPVGSNTTPVSDSPAGSPGGNAQYSRADHSHPSLVDNSIGSSTTRAPSQAAVAADLLDKEQASTALLSGGVITIAADPTKVNITAVTGIFVDNTNPLNPVSTLVTTAAFLSVTLPNIATQIGTYIGVNLSGALVLQNTPFTATQRRTIVNLGLAVHSNHVVVNAINQLSAPALQVGNQLVDFINAVGPLNLSGNEYSANGANLNINKSSGVLFKIGSGYPSTPLDPNEINLAAISALTFRYRMSNSTETADRTAIDPTQYEAAGVLTTLGNNMFSVQRVYMFQSNITRIQWGQAQYATMADAINGIRTESFVVEANAGANGVLRGFLVLKKEATALNNTTTAQFFSVSKFGAGQSNGAGSVITGADVITALGYTPENAALKGAASGYAPLNASSIVPLANLPSIGTPAINTPLANSGSGAVGSVTARYALEDHVHPASGGTGTVTTVSVVSANGLAGSVANATSTPAITLTTTVTGIVKGNGTSLSAAVAGDFPTLNQNTTGTASNVTGTVAVANGGTGATTLTSKGILFGNGTSAVGITGAGTAGQVLTSNGPGVDPTFQAAAGGGGGSLVLLSNTSVTAVANLDFLSIFTSAYDDYLIVFNNVGTSSADSPCLRFATSGSADTGANYSTVGFYTDPSVDATVFSWTESGNSRARLVNANYSTVYSGEIWLNNVRASNKTLSARLVAAVGASSGKISLINGSHFTAAAGTGFRLFNNSGGNFAAGGTIKVFGLKNS